MSGIFGGSKAPAPDPAIGQAALQNAALSKEMADVSREQLAEGTRRYEELKPFYREQMEQQQRIANVSERRGNEQWKSYEDLFAPLEEKMVGDARVAGSESEQEASAGRAAGSVAQQFGVARDNASRSAMAYGVNPGSAKYGEVDRTTGIQQAAAVAGASNQAREAEKTRGIALRSGVAQFGRGMAQTGIASDSLSLQGGNSAVNTAGAGTGSLSGSTAGAAPWMQGAVGANQSAGNLHLGAYNAQMQGYNANQQAKAGMFGALGNIAGMAFMSSKDSKTNKRPIAADGVLKKLKSLPVEKWDYKQGDGGTHVGPYAEDVNDRFGESAAPGGKMIDVVSMMGINIAATKALAKKVEALEAA